MPVFEIVVLLHLLVLKRTELGLDCVQLISQRKVILVPLLDLKYLGLQLRNEQVLLV